MASTDASDNTSNDAFIAHVVLDIPTKSIDSPFTYCVPHGMSVEVGSAVRVPFGKQQVVGFVVSVRPETLDETAKGPLKPIEEVLSQPLFSAAAVQTAQFLAERYIAPLPSCLRLFFPTGAAPKIKKTNGGFETILPKTNESEETWVCAGPEIDTFVPRKGAHRQEVVLDAVRQGNIRQTELRCLYGDVAATVKALAKAGAVVLEKRRRIRHAQDCASTYGATQKPEALTESQTRALAVVEEALSNPQKHAVLIDGVTGSGKTEVYLQAIEQVLARGQGAIVLVPEISLTPQTVTRFRGRFGDQVAVMHSKMSAGERYDQWDLVRLGIARIVVGARSALFMPVQNVGLIVIDEEHEGTYKQESAPRYVTRDVALWFAQQRNATVILGSATPSIESLYQAKHNPAWSYVRLPERANGKPLPPVEIIDMASEFRGGGRKVFSKHLENAIVHELQQQHKVVLLLNQRGFARFLLCRDCGFVPECRQCSTTLTFHEQGNKLVCHHCGYALQAPPSCPSCGSPYLSKYGMGTQRVEADLQALLTSQIGISLTAMPTVIRMDADTTSAKGSHQQLLEQFAEPGASVLLGTQMIAKGLDFEDVTLVGVINADTMLHLPDFRAAERTFALIQQVAGRAGRAALPGQVMVQTYEADSVAIQAAAHYNRNALLATELPKREVLHYPPYVRMANVLIWGSDAARVKACAEGYQQELEQTLKGPEYEGFEVLSATPCAFERIRNLTRWHIVVKCPPSHNMSDALGHIHRKRKTVPGVHTAVDIDPLDLL